MADASYVVTQEAPGMTEVRSPDRVEEKGMTTSVQHNVGRSRYELLVDGRLTGIADYVRRDDVIVFSHTEILEAVRGNGLGAVLVQGALDDVRGTGRRIVPACWYVARFVDKHAEYGDLVTGHER
jgi:uncharacterized protein